MLTISVELLHGRWFSAGLLVVPRGLIDVMAGRPAPPPTVETQALGRAGTRHRDGDRAPPRLRADRPRAQQARLRHREPRPGTGTLRRSSS